MTARRILLTAWGSFGDLHPYMALARALEERGHEAVVATLPIYREKVETAGIRFRPMRPDTKKPEDDLNLIHRALDPKTGAAVIMSELLMPHLEDAYNDVRQMIDEHPGFDLIVTHVLAFGAHLAARATGTRWLSTALSPLVFMSDFDPATPPIFPWSRNIACLHPAIAHLFGQAARTLSRGWVQPVNDLEKRLGLPPAGHPIFDGPYSPDGTLAMYSPLIGRVEADFPPHTTVTGFAFFDEDEERGGMTPQLERFLDECESAGEPPLLFTLGSSAVWDAGDFFRVSLRAVSRTKRRALILAGSGADELTASGLPPGIMAAEYAPYSRVMPRSRLVVHQGGVGTLGQTLRAGRPMLVMPFGHDTLDNARRATALGVGRILTRRRFHEDNLTRELNRILDDPQYATRADQVGRTIRSENGTGAACDRIEALLG